MRSLGRLEAVALARSGSVVNRTDTRKFTARLHETADEAGDVISEIGRDGVAQRKYFAHNSPFILTNLT